MTQSHSTSSPLRGLCISTALAFAPACGLDEDASGALTGFGETDGATATFGGDGDGDPANPGDGDPGDGDGDPGDGDGDGDPGDGDGDPNDLGPCMLPCGDGECVWIGFDEYCECPEGTVWNPYGCEPCPLIDAAGYDIDVAYIDFGGEFVFAGGDLPLIEYDDANIWLENLRTGDRVHLGNTHDGEFAVRVTPGIYDVIYEVESPGPSMPHNPRVSLGKVPLFSSVIQDVEIPAAQVSGQFLVNDEVPPAVEYDDANVFLRDVETGAEVLIGNTHEGSYSVTVVPGMYDLVYRVESPGDLLPRNDGAVLDSIEVEPGAMALDVAITSVLLQGEFSINTVAPPATEYDDANILLEDRVLGTVALGNTHDGGYALPVIPGTYDVVYMHETGASVPQNQRAVLSQPLIAAEAPTQIDIPMVALTGTPTINGAAPPLTEFDDGLLYLVGVDPESESEDLVLLGNTHDGAFAINVIPGDYEVHYSLETAGGTVPENKRARLMANVSFEADHDIAVEIPAVSVSGSLTVDGVQPPSSVYEDGRIYLRSATGDDSILLGSTHEGSYAAVVVPGDYEVFYAQEAGGEVPNNQNARLGLESIQGNVVLNLDVPVIDLDGRILLGGAPAPSSASDGGQVYLRNAEGDSVLIGDSFLPAYATKLVAGIYGVYYRSQASVMMPENDNGRFACVRVE